MSRRPDAGSKPCSLNPLRFEPLEDRYAFAVGGLDPTQDIYLQLQSSRSTVLLPAQPSPTPISQSLITRGLSSISTESPTLTRVEWSDGLVTLATVRRGAFGEYVLEMNRTLVPNQPYEVRISLDPESTQFSSGLELVFRLVVLEPEPGVTATAIPGATPILASPDPPVTPTTPPSQPGPTPEPDFRPEPTPNPKPVPNQPSERPSTIRVTWTPSATPSPSVFEAGRVRVTQPASTTSASLTGANPTQFDVVVTITEGPVVRTTAVMPVLIPDELATLPIHTPRSLELQAAVRVSIPVAWTTPRFRSASSEFELEVPWEPAVPAEASVVEILNDLAEEPLTELPPFEPTPILDESTRDPIRDWLPSSILLAALVGIGSRYCWHRTGREIESHTTRAWPQSD